LKKKHTKIRVNHSKLFFFVHAYFFRFLKIMWPFQKRHLLHTLKLNKKES